MDYEKCTRFNGLFKGQKPGEFRVRIDSQAFKRLKREVKYEEDDRNRR